MAESFDRFPLFPLGLVLLPSEVIPLHVFEERYKLMIGECIDGKTEFGVVWMSDDGLREVGCSAERGVVAYPQVAPEPDKCRHRPQYGRAPVRG